ncbi:spore coat protein JB [Oikeobacillus pervagus]|uniref:Spore coat protein JB n=1 Tax=Oikeobacillus pervagus TaxID=1325931 RepID=A0AAJ1SW83_9BACI|nr:spore coat protein CotJB [Oikeobacillus pervagus]MDQ0213724.1 spore coat protein JB [Oikeobacillus pervagus]
MKQVPPQYYKDLQELQAVDFVVIELALYLDTHPDDMDAIRQYNAFVQKSIKLKNNFEKNYGSLTSFGYSFSRHPWDWKEAPWPWQV